ncbi:uncharacterized protein LOC117648331 [Thrips palmi]|uniref:Uncharacterized protein LOC117648331 n=1 Tax=Thrips palmi TaxID=161013 RepID=A0A6P8Z2H9_THRPL|nr:uncharacterized protein LOC117648331 [Thrips palmi]
MTVVNFLKSTMVFIKFMSANDDIKRQQLLEEALIHNELYECKLYCWKRLLSLNLAHVNKVFMAACKNFEIVTCCCHLVVQLLYDLAEILQGYLSGAVAGASWFTYLHVNNLRQSLLLVLNSQTFASKEKQRKVACHGKVF